MSLKWHLPEEEEGDIKSKVQLKTRLKRLLVLDRDMYSSKTRKTL